MKKSLKKILCFALFAVICLGALTSCAPSYNKAKDSPVAMERRLSELEKTEGYEFYRDEGCEVEGEISDDIWIDGVEDVLEVVLYDYDSYRSQFMGMFFYCDSASDARKNVRALKKAVEIEDLDDEVADLVIRRDGKLVFIGERSLWRAATGNPWRGIIKGIATAVGIILAVVVVAIAIIVAAVVVVLLLMKKKKAAPVSDTKEAVITEAPVEETPAPAPAEEAIE